MKFQLDTIVRKNIKQLKAYSSARDEFSGDAKVFLDANENPFGTLNRYPDPQQKALKSRLSEIKNVAASSIFIGNGSDEVIDIAFRIFCEPGTDKALTFSPTYGMYDVSAAINDIELIKVPLNKDFQIDVAALDDYLNDAHLKLIFICTPNNPTGNLINKKDIEYILENFNGIVIVDEAYVDFSETASWNKVIEKYPNLIVSQTFSKAWGLAAARVGLAYMNKELLGLYNKVKPPYNVSTPNQEAALQVLNDLKEFEKNKELILTQRTHVIQELETLDLVKKIYPTDSNFVLVEVTDADQLYNDLVAKGVVTRNRNSVVNNCIRITIGAPEENKALLKELKAY